MMPRQMVGVDDEQLSKTEHEGIRIFILGSHWTISCIAI